MCLFCKACYNLMSLCSMCTLLIMALRNCLILSAFMFPGIEIYTLLMLTVDMCISVLSNDIFLIECLYLLIAWRGFARYLHSDHESLTSPCPFGSRLMTANLSCGCLSLLNYWSTILQMFSCSNLNRRVFINWLVAWLLVFFCLKCHQSWLLFSINGWFTTWWILWYLFTLAPWHGTDLDEYLCSGSLRRNAGKKTQDGSILIIHLPFFWSVWFAWLDIIWSRCAQCSFDSFCVPGIEN